MSALKEMAAPQATVLRDDEWMKLTAHDLAPGDGGNLALGTEPLSLRHALMLLFLSSLPAFGLSAIQSIFRLRFL